MLLAIYGDVHLTKKMGNLQDIWDDSAIKIFSTMYADFCDRNVESAICLGDFFDAPRLEAKSVKLVTEILSIINSSPFPTYFLLGNHEIFDDESNILDYLSEYENIIPVTELKEYEGKLFIPYNIKIEDVPESMLHNKYVFTHHDIYGSELASGKIKASFGIDPNLLSSAKRVFNGHIHLSSSLGNIRNVGSLLKSQQGELRLYDHPHVYYVDTDSDDIQYLRIMENFLAYLTIKPHQVEETLKSYDDSVKFVLKLEYDSEDELESSEQILQHPRIVKTSLKKSLKESLVSTVEYNRTNIDVKEIIKKYIDQDTSIQDTDRSRLLEIGFSLLEVAS